MGKKIGKDTQRSGKSEVERKTKTIKTRQKPRYPIEKERENFTQISKSLAHLSVAKRRDKGLRIEEKRKICVNTL